jgi:xanthine dehydrogenase accessory factor
LESVIPPARLIIAGAGHIGKALARIAVLLDFEITVIDDRPEFANSENIPFADHVLTGDIGNTIAAIEKGPDTYIVIVTRGHKDDANALRACIGSEATYLGMIGSKNKIALMKKEFIENGWATREQWDRIYSPVGLEINSKTVGEIAVSIAAQLVKVKNGGKIRS